MRFGQTESKLENGKPIIGLRRTIETVVVLGAFSTVYLGCHAANKALNLVSKTRYDLLGVAYKVVPADENHLFETIARKGKYQ